MIVAAAVMPTAPLLIPGVTAALPDGVGKVCDAIDAVTERMPQMDVAVLVAAGDAGIYDATEASLQGVGRPDVRATPRIHSEAVARLSAATQYPMYRGSPLPLNLAVLALHLGGLAPLAPIAVPATAEFSSLVSAGAAIARTFSDDDVRAAVVVAGDLSAGLTERSPLYQVDGALFWDEQAVAAVDSGRLGGLASLGPSEAERVGAQGWAPLAVLHGVAAAAKIGMVVRHYSAPRGVGYLVASGG